MRNLFDFLLKYSAFLSFLLLEGISLYLVVNFNDYQNSLFLRSAGELTGRFEENVHSFSRFLYVSEEMEALRNENARLREQAEYAYYNNQGDVDTTSTGDSARLHQFSFVPADVVNNSVNQANNYVTLNRGIRHGIRPHSGVISSEGLVGVVLGVSEHYCRVMSLLHTQTRISAAIRRNHAFGALRWNRESPQVMVLDDVPKHVQLAVGDSVVTSSYSGLFPPDLMIGYVDTFFVKPGSNFYHINVKLANDLSRLRYAYIVGNRLGDEQARLEKEVGNE